MKGERRIVIGVDGSASSLHALEWAARQAESTGCALEAFTTWAPPTAFMWSVYPDDMDLGAQATSAHVLIEASREAEPPVGGSRGYGPFSSMVLGSVSQYCVTQAHCPILVPRDSQ